MRTYFRILSYARPFGWYAPQYGLYTILYVVFGVLNLAMLIPVLDILFDQAEVTQTVLPEFQLKFSYLKELFNYHFQSQIASHGKMSALVFVCVFLIGSVLLSNLFRYLSSLILAKIRVNVITNLRGDFYQKNIQPRFGLFHRQEPWRFNGSRDCGCTTGGSLCCKLAKILNQGSADDHWFVYRSF